jgi:hypothetical protein
MAAKPRSLRLVDPETGEITEKDCPGCAQWETTYAELERKYRGALSQIGNLRADKEAEARADKLWGVAVALFHEWKIATGHTRSGWTGDRFWLCRPYLQHDGFPTCRYAVWGVAAHPNTKQVTKGYTERYDDFELVFRSRATFERYANRGWAVFGKQLPVPSFVEERENPAE